MEEGVQWIGGEASPPLEGTHEFIWWEWNVKSSKPCAECSSRNGTMSPIKRPKPDAWCRCTQTERWRICYFQNRTFVSSSTKFEKVEIGHLDPGQSQTFVKNEADESNIGLSRIVSVGRSHTEGEGNQIPYKNNTNEVMIIYEKWQIDTDTYLDTYDCKLSDVNEIVEVKRIETRLLGITSSAAETETIVDF